MQKVIVFFLIIIGFSSCRKDEYKKLDCSTINAKYNADIRMPVPWKNITMAVGLNLLFLGVLAGIRAWMPFPVLFFIPLSGLIYGVLLLGFRILKVQDILSYVNHLRGKAV